MLIRIATTINIKSLVSFSLLAISNKMAAKQYDLSPEKRAILEENAKRRAVLRNEFLKQVSDPFRHASGEGGTIFDPAMQRYAAMRVHAYEHFKPNPKTGTMFVFLTVIPIAGYCYLLQKRRNDREKRFRNGEVAYKDRDFKLI